MFKICLILALLAATASGQCDSGWSPFGQSCYILSPEAQTFIAHSANCENLGGWLVSISSADENSFINELLQTGCSGLSCSAAFIGLARNGAGQFTNWLDGTPFGGTSYSNWNAEEPNNGGEGCAEIIKDSGKWNDISCGDNRQALCEKPQPATWCESGWSPFGQCCYRVLAALKNAYLHSNDCQNGGGQLVSISSEAENKFVKELHESECPHLPCPGAFIGLRRDFHFPPAEGNFSSWVDGSAFGGSFYANWIGGEPNNVDGFENCVETRWDIGSGKWADVSCDLNRKAVCENCQLPATTSTTSTPTTTVATTKPTTSTSITVGNFDCRTVRTNVNCGAANGPAACDAQCRLFKYGRGICYSFGTTSCPGYAQGSKGCLCYDTLDCRTLRTQVNCAAANAALSCTNWCKLFQWTRGACTTFTSLWTCPGYASGQKACLCQ